MLSALLSIILLFYPVTVHAAAPTVTLKDRQATVVGSTASGVDSFKGIPFGQAPVGSLRLKPPNRVTTALGTVQATGSPQSCPQFTSQTHPQPSTLARRAGSPEPEDCLTLNVQRPSVSNSSKLPVVFWIYGGGFETGGAGGEDATNLIKTSIQNGHPVMYVAANYRLGGFGFLASKEILKDGSANLGLLDQRMALEWVADNIEYFGGDPTEVTIWGESAGAISVFDQMALYNGNHSYKGQQLFRAALMDSGSIVPTDPVDSPKVQAIYHTVVDNGGCTNATGSGTLQCLRGLSFADFQDAVNSVPPSLSYYSVALSYLPRPDGRVLTDSPELLVERGQYAKVPFISGTQEDEGTVLALPQLLAFPKLIVNTDDLITYLSTIFFPSYPRSRIASLVSTYPKDPAAGSPYRTGLLYNIYPQFKRLAAILGDIVFILTRRYFLDEALQANPDVPSWSYIASYDHLIPVLGTSHSSDLPRAYGQVQGFPTVSTQTYYLSFFNTMDPNAQAKGLTHWPQWAENRTLLHLNALSNDLLTDDFRNASYSFLINKANVLRI